MRSYLACHRCGGIISYLSTLHARLVARYPYSTLFVAERKIDVQVLYDSVSQAVRLNLLTLDSMRLGSAWLSSISLKLRSGSNERYPGLDERSSRTSFIWPMCEIRFI